jgi:hypothetical protein
MIFFTKRLMNLMAYNPMNSIRNAEINLGE